MLGRAGLHTKGFVRIGKTRFFDRFTVKSFTMHDLCEVELFFIKRFRPILNVALNPDYSGLDCYGRDKLRCLMMEDFSVGGYGVRRFKERLKEVLDGSPSGRIELDDVHAVPVSVGFNVPKGVGVRKVIDGEQVMVFNIDGVYHACGVGGNEVVLDGRRYRIDKRKAFVNVANLFLVNPFERKFLNPFL
jgi:hypothetical protein